MPGSQMPLHRTACPECARGRSLTRIARHRLAVLAAAGCLAGGLVAGPRAQSGPSSRPASPAGPSAVEARVERLLAQLTLDEKLSLIAGVDGFYVPGLAKIGLPRLKMSDGPAGARNDGAATTMAGGIALAATWSMEVAAEVGTQIGRDARARGVHVMLGPGVNLHVAPQNGRNFEYFGEDPYLAGRIAASYIQGLQSLGVAATVKHLLGNNSEYARHAVNAVIDERTLREIYLPAFEMAVRDGKVAAIMTSYNRVNGIHMSQHGALVNDIVKQEWGFDGIVMSDWTATHDGVAAANGGQDLEMPGPAFMNPATLKPAIAAGTVRVATIDDKVRRLLRTAIRFGWLERDQEDLSIPRYNPLGRVAALQGARDGTVLLKNDGALLPLDETKIATIAVIGPLAHPGAPVGGGSGQATPFANVSLLEGLGAVLGTNVTVTYHRGLPTLAQIAGGTPFHTAPRGGRPGLTVEQFDNATLAGTPVATRVDRRVNEMPAFTVADVPDMDAGELFAGMATAGPPAPWSARWTGYYDAAADEAHEVFLQAGGEHGGTRVAIDDEVVIDNWTMRRAGLGRATLHLRAGTHKVVLERFHTGERDFFSSAFRLGIARQAALVTPAARALAKNADVVIVAAGWDATIEGEGSDRTFGLPIGQDQLIREMAAANPRTVVVLTSGGAVDTSAWIDRVPALLAAWFPGQEGGTAIAEILLGKVNPSGHLPDLVGSPVGREPVERQLLPERGAVDGRVPQRRVRRLPRLRRAGQGAAVRVRARAVVHHLRLRGARHRAGVGCPLVVRRVVRRDEHRHARRCGRSRRSTWASRTPRSRGRRRSSRGSRR